VNRWSLTGVGLGVYALALIAIAPATLVDAGLQQGSQGRLRLTEARGTLWSGSGRMEIREAGGQSGLSENLAWRIVPASLLRGQLVCEIGLAQAEKHFPVTLSLSRIELANADISLPAAVLGLGVPKLAPLGLTGTVSIHVTRLSIARDAMVGNATVQWRAAGSALSSLSPLGDYEMQLDAEGATVNVQLGTLKGPLRLDGKGSWRYGNRPAFLGMARVAPPDLQRLAPLLRLIAIERSEGNFELQLN
jgi:general secretion pathway protein N